MIHKGNLVAWEKNGKLVSMACATRPTQNNITISYVYTPLTKEKRDMPLIVFQFSLNSY